MIHIQHFISTKDKDKGLFWIKPLWCPIGRPFCIVRWSTKQCINICSFYCGVRREGDRAMRVWCNYDELPQSKIGAYTYSFKLFFGRYDELSKSNISSGVPEDCPRCMHYLGDICIINGELQDNCTDFVDTNAWLET